MISSKLQRIKYLAGDFLMANIGWFIFNHIRYNASIAEMHKEGFHTFHDFLFSDTVMLGQIIIPLAMLLVFAYTGYYKKVFMKSRLQELGNTMTTIAVSSLGIFFAVMINDTIDDRLANYELIANLWLSLFIPVYTLRLIITTHATWRIQNRKWSFNTLIIGNGKSAHKLSERLNKLPQSLGYKVVGYVNINNENGSTPTDGNIVYEMSEIKKVCAEQNITNLILVPTKSNQRTVYNLLNELYPLNLPIKMTANLMHVLMSRSQLSNFTGEMLVDVSNFGLSDYENNIKRTIDIVLSLLAIIVLSPMLLILPILIKIDSKGPIIYLQERVGYRNKVFNIYKFRTMVDNAESDGVPRLSANNDDRITKLGKFMRKYRIDEIPQFFNVLRGDMSLVGPRPERQYYIDLIMKEAPYYALIHQVKPGLTSLGMVKYGYASSVPQMLTRLKFDIIYIENMSIMNDFKIMIFTIKTVITGKGL